MKASLRLFHYLKLLLAASKEHLVRITPFENKTILKSVREFTHVTHKGINIVSTMDRCQLHHRTWPALI